MRPRDRRVAVSGSWALSGAALGLLAEVLFPSGVSPWGTLAGAGLGGASGWWAASRAVGRRLPLWLDLAPRLSLGLALALLAMVLAVVEAPGLAAVALLVGVGIASSVRRPVARRRLALAVESLGQTDPSEALVTLAALSSGWWVPPAVRAEAALQRGAWALAAEGAHAAVPWLVAVRHRALVGHAAPWLALAHAASGRDEEAGHALRPAYGAVSPETRAHAEAVRLLLVLRIEGPQEAERLGGSLLTATPVAPLAFGVVAVARLRSGDPDGARVLLTPGVVEALVAGGLHDLLEEIAEAVRHAREAETPQSFCE